MDLGSICEMKAEKSQKFVTYDLGLTSFMISPSTFSKGWFVAI
jgi:hypothetical protein